MSRNKVEPVTTPWFPISVQPVRAGVYQVLTKTHSGAAVVGPVSYALWTGDTWNSVSHIQRSARKQKLTSMWMKWPQAQWRGLAQEPKQ